MTNARPSELTLPVASFSALRRAMVEALGEQAAADAMRQAGYAAGDSLHSILGGGAEHDPGEIPVSRFWSDFARLFSSRGWGRLAFVPLHEGVGSLESNDWFEATDGAGGQGGQPSCHFTTGLLANVLGQVAGADIAVLEVECRSRGDSRCRFLFGGSEPVFRVYEEIAGGSAPDDALAQIG